MEIGPANGTDIMTDKVQRRYFITMLGAVHSNSAKVLRSFITIEFIGIASFSLVYDLLLKEPLAGLRKTPWDYF